MFLRPTKQQRYPKAEINWYVRVEQPHGNMEGITKNVSPTGVYICCARPLKLNEVFEISMDTQQGRLRAEVEVIFSNRFGPNDEITPRGMGVCFLKISDKDRSIIAKALVRHSEQKEIAEEYMNTVKLEIKQKKHNLTLIK